jgi:radical SAM superfamily enzyme YgiQ (UPF0313 family)
MKVTLVYPDVLLHRPDWTGYFYYGIGLLSSVLKQAGHQTSLIHVTQPINQVEFISRIKKEDPGLIGFSSTSHMFSLVRQLVSWLKESEIKIPVICGGIHPTIAPEEAIGVDGIDIICRGEGESPLVELCRNTENNEDISTIMNLWIKRGGNIIKNPLRPLLDNLDKLPFPDRTIFDYRKLYAEREDRGSFLVGRGCPYNCAYCCNHLLRKIYGSEGKPTRFRSVDNLIAEIKEVIGHYPFITTLIFDDDILFLKRKWSEEFAEKYGKEIKLPFACNARANLLSKDIITLLKKAGCYHVKFGLESGNEDISNNVLSRQLKNEHIKKAFALCKEAGMATTSFNMVGIPGETPAAIFDTIKLNAAINVDHMQVSIYQPYPGTKLAELCHDQHMMESRDLETDFFSPSLVKLDTVSSSQVLMFRDYFRVLVRYFQFLQKLPKGISKVFMKITESVLSFAPTAKALNLIYLPLNYFYRRMLFLSLKAKDAQHKVTPR